MLPVGYHEVQDLLGETFTAEGVDIWLSGRNKSLGGERPIDLLEEGRLEEVLAAADRLASGAFV